VESEEGFLGDNIMRAVERAKKRYPDKIFYIKKIGFSAVERISRYLPFHYFYEGSF